MPDHNKEAPMEKKGHVTCPACNGAKQVQGYYTMPPHDCEFCGGEGSVTEAKAKTYAAPE